MPLIVEVACEKCGSRFVPPEFWGVEHLRELLDELDWSIAIARCPDRFKDGYTCPECLSVPTAAEKLNRLVSDMASGKHTPCYTILKQGGRTSIKLCEVRDWKPEPWTL